MNDEQTLDFFVNEKKLITKNMLTYPFMFSKEVINTLYKHCQIIILSSREDKYWNNKTYIFAKKWLKKYKFKFDMIKVNCIDKAGFCKNNNIDIMIEDNLEYVKKNQ